MRKDHCSPRSRYDIFKLDKFIGTYVLLKKFVEVGGAESFFFRNVQYVVCDITITKSTFTLRLQLSTMVCDFL